ncbi:MAG: hypothetical protein PF541_14515, partial [Prolixibacteraceae bacterium]|nr:hypothetical protein [Prolixibacteraceae bacterium]
MGVKTIKSFIIIFVLFLSLFKSVFALQNVILEDLSSSTELPEGAINKLVQDESGFIWLGTWKGLYRYDGYDAVNFSTINPEFNALKIKDLLINGDDLWVATFVSGLFRIDLTTYEVHPYLKESESNYQINENNIISLCASSNNSILVGTERAGLNIIDSTYSVKKSITLNNSPNILRSNQVSSIVPWDSETVILGNYSLLFFNFIKNEVIQIDHPLLNNHIVEIAKIQENELLVSTLEGLFLVNLETPTPKLTQLLDFQIRSIVKNIFSTNESYLLATLSGVLEYHDETK